MEKLLAVIAMAILFPLLGQAQLKVESKTGACVKIASARMGLISLQKDANEYFLVMNSSNKIEQPGIFYLGFTKETTMATIKDLIALWDTLKVGDSVNVKDHHERDASITRITSPCLQFNFSHLAGDCWATKRELTKFLSEMEKQ